MSKFSLLFFLALANPLLGATATIEAKSGGSTTTTTVVVIKDSDGDGLTDEQEAVLGTNPSLKDSDGDGLSDKQEVDSGKNPLINQFAVELDWGLPSTTIFSKVRGFWDFESYSNPNFISRKGSSNAKAMPSTQAGNIWDSTSGMLGKSAKVGGSRYLEIPPKNLWENNRIWNLSFYLKMESYPSNNAVIPLFSVYTGSPANVAPALQVSIVRIDSGTVKNYYIRLHNSSSLYGEWKLPTGFDLKKWNAISLNSDGSWYSDERWCYVNGSQITAVNNNGQYSYDQLPSFAGGNADSGYILIGATKTSNGTVSISPVNISLDRLLISSNLSKSQMAALTSRDTDGDGYQDHLEDVSNGFNPVVYDDVNNRDDDSDGLSNIQESSGQAVFNGVNKTFGATNKKSRDTDGDLFDDFWEAKYYYIPSGSNVPNVSPISASVPIKDDPTTPNIIEGDYDADGLSNYQEMLNGTDPNKADTDGDGINDKDESNYGSNPLDYTEKPLNPQDYYGDENLGSYFPIGDLGVTLTNEGGNSSAVTVRVGDPSGSHSERWGLEIGKKRVSSDKFGEVSNPISVALDPTNYHRIELVHYGTDPTYLQQNNNQPDYDYWATVKPDNKSPFILCDPHELLQDPDSDPEQEFVNDVDPSDLLTKIAYLVPLENDSLSVNFSGSDAVGPRYRKVALNGRPIADEKPQQEKESDQPEEETYVDAFNLSLHHDTTFNYTPLGSSDLVIQSSISSEETGFSSRSGLRPSERFDLPFGAGWSSNLCSYVEVVQTIGDDSNDPVTVNVVDESGRPQRFGTYNFQTFFPWPSGKTDKKTYLNTLTRNGNGFTYQKKYGTTLSYGSCKTWFMYSTDRINGSKQIKKHTYWRLEEAKDRYGVRLQYDYDSAPGVTNEVSLIPRKIFSPDRVGQFLVIDRSADSRRVESITDSRGNVTHFNYDSSILAFDVVGNTGLAPLAVPRLASVVYADQTTTNYTYSGGIEVESDTSNPDELRNTFHFHINLKTLTDKRGNTYSFDYAFDSSKQYWDSNVNGSRCAVEISTLPTEIQGIVEEALAERNQPGHGQWKAMYGMGRRVSSVTLPGGIGNSTFQSQGLLRFGETASVVISPQTTVTDAAGNSTIYNFEQVQAEKVKINVTATSASQDWMVYYLTTSIHHGGAPGQSSYVGTETFRFDPASGFSLSQATDLSGNTTTWEFNDNYGELPAGLPIGSALMSKWADPTAKVDALGRRENYTYSENFRIMDSISDAYNTTTLFETDNLGRRRSKRILQNGNSLLQYERYDFNNSRIQGFQTGEVTVAYANVSGQNWEKDLNVIVVPDSLGRKWQEIKDPQGEKITTETTYDLNNNKTSFSDGRKFRTSFVYDKLNRLTQVTYPIAGTNNGSAATTKQIWYNSNGSKAAEIDEEGRYTIYHYDSLNRLIKKIRDMDGVGLPVKNANGIVSEDNKGFVTGNDLVSSFGYDAVGAVIFEIDPKGTVKRTFYDSILRPIHVFTGLTQSEVNADLAACSYVAAGSNSSTHTEMRYVDSGLVLPGIGTVKGNPGGSAFDSSGFKPTEIIKHGAVRAASGILDLHTYTQYDATYRPLKTLTEYENGAYSLNSIAYGIINNSKESLLSITTDSRGKLMRTTKDGLQRVISVIDAYGTPLASTTQTIFSSTGLSWKTIDPLGRESETEYDGVGRAVKIWQPDPASGVVNRSSLGDPLVGSPCTQTAYDKNNNVTVTLNPLGFRWEFEYDARNRKTLERQPTITQTEIVAGQPQETAFQTPLINTSYDGVGNVIAVKNARGHVSRTFFDQANRAIASLSNPVTGAPSTNYLSPGSHDIVIRTAFDSNGNALEVIDGNGNATRNTYDRLNRLVSTAINPVTGQPSADPASPVSGDITVVNEYDDAGGLTKVTDGAGRVTGFRYDGLTRKTRTLWDEGSAVERIEQSTFDGLVQLTCIDPKGQLTSFQYDALNRLSDVLYTGASVDNRHLAYDLNGNLLAVTYPNETAARKTLRGVTQVFDKLNRLTEETSAGATHVHTLDKAGNRRNTIYAATGRYLASTYDKLNRLVSCAEKASSGASVQNLTGYFYDLNGNVTRKVLPNGTATNSTFDALNRKLGEVTKTSGGGLVSSFDYSQPTGGFASSHDNAGNLLRIVEAYGDASVKARNVTNSYDRTYRLTREVAAETGGSTVTTDYTYDAGNNRTGKVVSGGSAPGTSTFAYGTTADGYNSNQLKSVTKGTTVTTFSYDANGNRILKQVGGVTTQSYSFDYENRLIGLTDNSGTYGYSYDHRTRRVGRNESSAGGVNSELSFAGGLSVQEYTSGASLPNVETIRGSDYGGGIGGVLYTIRSGARSYNAYNSRGDVVSKTDDGGAITWQSSYEAFGTRTQENGTTQDRQKANTKDEDPTGLLNEGMRYRDLEFGAFLTRDPAGFVDGPNVYTYVTQNPWTSFDPEGLASVKETLKDDKITYKEAKTLTFEKGEAEAILDANKIKKITPEAVRKDIVGKNALGEEYVKDTMVWPNEDTQYSKNWKSGMSIDEVVITETARRNQSLAKQAIVREFKDQQVKTILKAGEVMSYSIMEGSQFVIPAVGGAIARGGAMIASAISETPAMATNMVTVSRWGRPGLESGDFVMKGGANRWNYFKSGKWQPGMGNKFTPFKAGEEFVVPKSSLVSPARAATATAADTGAAGLIKQAMGQRAYIPE